MIASRDVTANEHNFLNGSIPDVAEQSLISFTRFVDGQVSNWFVVTVVVAAEIIVCSTDGRMLRVTVNGYCLLVIATGACTAVHNAGQCLEVLLGGNQVGIVSTVGSCRVLKL